MMRELGSPPSAVIDPSNLSPRVGAFRGALPPVDFTPLKKSSLYRLTHQKRWLYVAIASPELYIGLAVAHLGYLMNCFVFAFDRRKHKVAVDRSALGPTFFGQVGDRAGEGCHATFCLGATCVRIQRVKGDAQYRVEVEAKGLTIDARLATDKAPSPISVVAPVPGGVVNTTEKRALLDVTGEAIVAGERLSLDGALAGYDYTNGYLARHTAWKWAFALGKAKSGERIGLNLVEGFLGESECAVWIGDELFALGEGRFEHQDENPLAPWRVKTADGRVDLAFSPGGMHAEKKNFGVVASKFIQPVGTFSGTIRVDGRDPIELDRVLGVTEDQDVLW